MSLAVFRRLWFQLLEEEQGPGELRSKPTDSQVVKANTELKYERTDRPCVEAEDGPAGHEQRFCDASPTDR
jgi:hypothetical protein